MNAVIAEKEPKKRRVRRNYEKELSSVETFVRVSIEVIDQLNLESEFMKGQRAALNAVLQRMENKR